MKTRIIQNDPDDGVTTPAETAESDSTDVHPDAPQHAEPGDNDKSPT